jgi:hypothetical protein
MPGNDGIVRSYGQARKALLLAERCNWTALLQTLMVYFATGEMAYFAIGGRHRGAATKPLRSHGSAAA